MAGLFLVSLLAVLSVDALPKRNLASEPLDHQAMLELKKVLFDRMGFVGDETVRDRTVVPLVMHRLYKRLGSSPCSNKVYRIVPVRVVQQRSSSQFLELAVPDTTELLSAELRLKLISDNQSDVKLMYEDIVKSSPDNATISVQKIAIQEFIFDATDREMIWNITEVVRKSRMGFHAMRFELTGSQADLRSAYILLTSATNQKCDPDTNLHLKQSRGRRDTQNGRRLKKNKRNCKRKKLYVDFQEIGWDKWIISPIGYKAFYCDGFCTFPFSDHLNATNHAVIQTMVSSSLPSGIPSACCVPDTLLPITMLYLDNSNQVVLRQYADMVANSCACR